MSIFDGVPLLDLRRQYMSIKSEVEEAVRRVFDSQIFIMGEEVEAFEAEIAQYCGVDYAIGVSSGTDSLLMSLMAAGVGSGDEVITTPYTFFATIGSILRLGAIPVFVDIEPNTYNLDPCLIEANITKKTKAVLPVHLFGHMSNMNAIMNLAERYKLIVIEDAAQALGASLDGKKAGSFGHFGCFSFFPSKNLGGAGDGGMIVTRSKDFAIKLKSLRNHGQGMEKYYHKEIGGNFRLDALQAAVLRVKLRYLDRWTIARQANAARYIAMFASKPFPIVLPKIMIGYEHVYNQFVIRLEADRAKRDLLLSRLRNSKIGCEVYYPLAHHMQECLSSISLKLGYRPGSFLHSERAAFQSFAIPVFPELRIEEQDFVIDKISEGLCRIQEES